jgi:hypothetical protein
MVKTAARTHRKTAYALGENILVFVERTGLDRCGFFTVTFDAAISPRQAQRRMNNFARRILKKLFGARVRVSEFTDRGRIHYHCVVDCGGDVRSGFNWAHYSATREWSRGRGARRDKPRGDLRRTPHLRELHLALNAAAPRYHIGRVELVPLKSTAEAVGRYVGGYIAKGERHHTRRRHKGLRWVNYTRSAPRVVGPGPWSWGRSGRTWRRKLERWAAKHSCATLDDVRAVFGPHWAYHHREAILATDETLEPVAEATQPPPAPAAGSSRAARPYVLRSRPRVESCWQRPLRLSG